MVFIPEDILNKLKEIIDEAVNYIISRYNDGDIPDEESITERFAQSIETKTKMNNTFTDDNRKYEIDTKIKSFNKRTEEPKVGADIAITIRYTINEPYRELFDFHFERNSRNVTYQKTILIQSKREHSNPFEIYQEDGKYFIETPLNREKIKKLIDQCSKMVKKTKNSFVLIYGKKDFHILPAQDFLGRNNEYAKFTNSKLLSDFYREYWACEYGDYELIKWNDVLYEDFYELVNPKFHLIHSMKIKRR